MVTGIAATLFDFQEQAVIQLLDLCTDSRSKQTIVMKAPTGSGKTIMLIDFVDEYLNKVNSNAAFIWLCPGKGDLEEQSRQKMRKFAPHLNTQNLFDALQNGFEPESTTFINWELVTKKGNTAIRDSERKNLFDRIADAYNENSGLLNDLMAPNAAGSQVNGWWTGYGLVKDCHCAYTVGSAVHYLTKTMDYLHQNGKPCPAKWMDAAQKVLHTVMDLQRADGAFGYTYSTQERKVLDWSGFAGCWFAPALVYLYRLTGEERCLHSAEKALDYYHTFVKDLNCYGTPMDTWKAVDEEGNLAFMRGSRLLYEQTGKAEFLQYMKDSAGYEFLWRYGYKTYPEHTPLNQGWSACGGAVTSVSNPHIHPMGVIIDTDLRYLARVTGDGYYASRAADSAAWMLQCLELYPAATGYGRYGILSERWCPSDGLDVERFSDGRPFSSWFSHNLWASACVLEAACELLLEIEHKKG